MSSEVKTFEINQEKRDNKLSEPPNRCLDLDITTITKFGDMLKEADQSKIDLQILLRAGESVKSVLNNVLRHIKLMAFDSHPYEALRRKDCVYIYTDLGDDFPHTYRSLRVSDVNAECTKVWILDERMSHSMVFVPYYVFIRLSSETWWCLEGNLTKTNFRISKIPQ